MDEKRFIANFVQPSDKKMDEAFTHPLPKIEGLRKCAEFVIQSEDEETFSTNIVTRFASDSLGIKLFEVYKNTEHKGLGIFVRIVGALTVVKVGYPLLFLDAAVSNVSHLTTQREDLTTRVAIHLPQAAPEQQQIFFSRLREAAEKDSVTYRDLKVDAMPDFWGSIWLSWKHKQPTSRYKSAVYNLTPARFRAFEHSDFEFVSGFALRISSLSTCPLLIYLQNPLSSFPLLPFLCPFPFSSASS
jgi:hypothetical protein